MYDCKICGFEGLEYPQYLENGEPNFCVCPCCGFESGYDDLDQGFTFAEYRKKWLDRSGEWLMDSKKTVIQLLEAYIEEANQAAIKMMKDFGAHSKTEFFIKKELYLKGELILNTEKKYIFHGRGCRVLDKYDNCEIDWDFGCDDIWVGLNPGLFSNYIRDRKPEYCNLYNYSRIETIFKESVLSGEMHKKYGLYYLNKKIHL